MTIHKSHPPKKYRLQIPNRIPVLSLFSLLTLTGLLLGGAFAGQPTLLYAQSIAPTLVPPTLVPASDAGVTDALLSESGLARIQSEGTVRVGILYNAPPFGELNIRGDVTGFDADLARSIAEAWGVEIELMQVTRQTAIDMLRAGAVDLLIAGQVHHRDLDALVEFSQTYYYDNQSMLVRNDDGASVLAHMADRNVGVVLGRRSEAAVEAWRQRSGININVRTYLTIDQAFSALLASEIDGLVDSQVALNRLNVAQPGLAKFVEEPVSPEPYAIAIRRQDVNLRNLVNRTLQYLAENGRMEEIYGAHFPNLQFEDDTITVWEGVGDSAPQPGQFSTGVPYPTQPVTPRLQSGEAVRVAGLNDLPEDATESQRLFDTVQRQVIEALAARWRVPVEFIPNSRDNAIDLVATGQADLALGVTPDWSRAEQVDFTNIYFLHGQRLMVPFDSDIEGFNELRGKWVATFADEPDAVDRVNELAESVNVVSIQFFSLVNEEDSAFAILDSENADVVFGDSLRLIPHVRARPEELRLTERWYSHEYSAFAVPRNDIDFRLLVEYTLQELAQDGTLDRIVETAMLPEDIPTFEVWPGSTNYLGFTLYELQG